MYETEQLGKEVDDGTMPENVAKLATAVVGHKIINAEMAQIPYPWDPSLWEYNKSTKALVLTLDNGYSVQMLDTEDCCAHTELHAFLLNVQNIDHVITGVGTTDGYTTWHIFADFGDVLELTVDWSCGNPFDYGYGFDIRVLPSPHPITPSGT